MIRKSFQLIRTNPLLTTNIKTVVTSTDSIYLESFNSTNELSDTKYKHVRLNKNDYLEDKIPIFYDKLPSDIAFSVKYNNDASSTYNDYSYQFDNIYFAGADKVEDTWYNEEFEYNAPLYIRNNSLPTNFIILRCDDPSNYNINVNNNFQLSSLTKDNFYTEIIDKWKSVEVFDLTTKSNIGKFLDKNFVKNTRFPSCPFYFDVRRTEFSKWFGMDYNSGIYTEKDFYLEDTLSIEQLHFKLEKLVTEGYKNNKLIFPNILNLKFLFDDTPATPDALKKYSMNRYYGFYTESMDFVGSITSYQTPDIKPGFWLINNIIVSGDTGVTWDACDLEYHWLYPSNNPFVEPWDDTKNYYIFLDNTDDYYKDITISGLYPVKKVIQNGITVWKVISDTIMDEIWNPSGRTYASLKYHPERVNMKTCNIEYEKFNILTGYTNDFFIDKYLDLSGRTHYMYGDLYLINIDGIYHVLKNGSGITYSDFDIDNKNDVIDKYYIQTDWGINSNSTKLEYWINGKNSNFYQTKTTTAPYIQPLQFNIYRVKFSDIKDFDFDRVYSDFSNFDYEQTFYVDTPEEKLHAIDYTDDSIPKDFKLERYGSSSQFKISNVSSEYIADDELFELKQIISPTTTILYQNTMQKASTLTGIRVQRELTDLWRKNQSICKWGFMGSNSHSDYAYKLDNSLSVGGVFNRTTNPFSYNPYVLDKNLDYFYRIGNFYNGTFANKHYYKFQSTNIEDDFVTSQIGGKFNIGTYFNTDFDYFTFYFKNKMNFLDNGILYQRNYDKYSVFNYGDTINSSVTLFKGIKVNIKSIYNIDTTQSANLPTTINKILYDLTKNYNGYKFSIILNDVYGNDSNGIENNKPGIITNQNGINIILNERWKNVLIVINFVVGNLPIQNSGLNNVSKYDEKNGLYYGLLKDGTRISNYKSNVLTAYNFINSINIPEHSLTNPDPPFSYIRYYYITEYKGETYYGFSDNIGNSTMSNIPNWGKSFSPYILYMDYPDAIQLNSKKDYRVDPYVGPDTKTILGYTTNEPLGRVVIPLQMDRPQVGIISTTSFIPNKNEIYRMSGPYEPIFKDINVFKGGFYYYLSGTTTELLGNISSGGDPNNTYTYLNPLFNIVWNPNNGWTNTNAMCRVITNTELPE